jgi:hypothetical protein
MRGFTCTTACGYPAEDRAFALRLARYCARCPVALERLDYRSGGAVTYQSDKATGPTAGTETVDALDFLARVVSHIPDKGQVLQRYYGWYANRTRGIRRRTGGGADPVVVVAAPVGRAAAPPLRGRPAHLSPVRT